MDFQERLTRLKVLGENPVLPVLRPGEIPWQEVEDPVGRHKAYNSQRGRVWNMLNPGRHVETNRIHEANHPGAQAEAVRRHEERHPGARAEKRKRFAERHPGYFAEATRKSYERHPGSAAEANSRHEANHPGAKVEANRRYFQTPGGRAKNAEHHAARKEHSTDPALYAARVYMLHDLQEPCAVCGAPYDITHQIDHIVAYILGGTDDWDNMRPICISCHIPKTGEDMRKYREITKGGISDDYGT